MLDRIHNFLALSNTLATSGQPSVEQFQAVAEAGYEVVINLGLHDAEYALENEEAVIVALGMRYVHIPVEWENPTRERLLEFLQAMEDNRERLIFLHCAANMRVSIFIALYRILREGWAAGEAMREVEKIWKPNQIWRRFFDDMCNMDFSGLVNSEEG